ncbi:MAG TPA: hypothetical protein VNQ79_28550 [Blastocatellia bacterium]|nr:hypothetical protein [Blastocatellia bacterium]
MEGQVIEGIWEEIVSHAQDLVGRRVKVIILDEPETLRPYGLAAGEFTVPDDFDDPLPDEILDSFAGR